MRRWQLRAGDARRARRARIIISEFSALGSEFIELHNTTASDIDVHGYTLRNAAGVEVDIRAPSDPNGTAGTPVVVTAGGNLYGIANPSGAIPGGVGFVYGAPGTAFSLADTGDAVALYCGAARGQPAGRGGLPLLQDRPQHPADGERLRRLRGQLHPAGAGRA